MMDTEVLRLPSPKKHFADRTLASDFAATTEQIGPNDCVQSFGKLAENERYMST